MIEIKAFKRFFKEIFTFRDRMHKVGTILAASSFLPTFMIVMMLCGKNHFLEGLAILLVSQTLMLNGVNLCCSSLERENRRLKKILNDIEEWR